MRPDDLPDVEGLAEFIGEVGRSVDERLPDDVIERKLAECWDRVVEADQAAATMLRLASEEAAARLHLAAQARQQAARDAELIVLQADEYARSAQAKAEAWEDAALERAAGIVAEARRSTRPDAVPTPAHARTEPATDRRSPPQKRGEMLSLPGVRVTDNWFVVGQRRYDIRKLDHLRTVRGPRHPMVGRFGIGAGIGLALFALSFQQLNPLGMAGAITAVLLLGAAAFAINWRHPRNYELWANYQGLMIQLYYSDDPVRFGAVCRALIRVRERDWLHNIPAASASGSATQARYTQSA